MDKEKVVLDGSRGEGGGRMGVRGRPSPSVGRQQCMAGGELKKTPDLFPLSFSSTASRTAHPGSGPGQFDVVLLGS